jgi:release factor glutamine methyltransferase
MTGHFTSRQLQAPRLVAEMLLAHVLECPRLRLYMEIDRPATAGELERLRALVAAAARHEPVQYLIGEASFYWRAFAVGDCTLIPQPSTETLVEEVIRWLGGEGAVVLGEPDDAAKSLDRGRTTAGPTPQWWIADIGTGCGCIAVTLAAQVPGLHVLATDVEPAALELARANAQRHGVADRLVLREGPGLEPVGDFARARGLLFDAICSNPPYIPDSELDQMDESVRTHVPRRAWHGGPDGLQVIGPLIAGAGRWLRPGGLLAVEIAHSQHDQAIQLARDTGRLADPRVLKDHEDYWRVLVAERK